MFWEAEEEEEEEVVVEIVVVEEEVVEGGGRWWRSRDLDARGFKQEAWSSGCTWRRRR